jgi:hypothetical protein
MHLQQEDFDMAWYYKDGDREIGPVNKAQLQQLITTGKIGAQTMLRRADADRWQPLIKLVKSGERPKKKHTAPVTGRRTLREIGAPTSTWAAADTTTACRPTGAVDGLRCAAAANHTVSIRWKGRRIF